MSEPTSKVCVSLHQGWGIFFPTKGRLDIYTIINITITKENYQFENWLYCVKL